jgi:hypothetical protein
MGDGHTHTGGLMRETCQCLGIECPHCDGECAAESVLTLYATNSAAERGRRMCDACAAATDAGWVRDVVCDAVGRQIPLGSHGPVPDHCAAGNHDWHHYGTVNGVPHWSCQTCGADTYGD